MLSEKYIAGFLDADGSFGIIFRKKSTGLFPHFYLQFSQETAKDKVLYLMNESMKCGSVHQVRRQSVLTIQSKQARMVLSRISKHLVIKRQYADFCLDLYSSLKGPYSPLEARKFEKELSANRKKLTKSTQNHPTRKWLAGYFDGDGCIGYSYRKNTGCTYISARIVAEPAYKAGIELLNKAFGGGIYQEKHKEGVYPVWVLHLPPSKAISFFGYFGKHSVVKKDQIDFVLGCAKGGNYRDGKTIVEAIKQLKAREQRLSDRGADIQSLLSKVDFNRELKRNRPVSYRHKR